MKRIKLKLKVGRHTYSIGKIDVFMDNKSCVQLITQSKEKSDWGRQPRLILSKRAVKEINQFERIQLQHNYKEDYITLFKLGERNER